MKIYKYRPNSEFLFKELYYQELYLASYYELNDPLDLSANIDFSVKKEEEIDVLLEFLFSSSFKIYDKNIPKDEEKNNSKLIEFINDKEVLAKFKKKIFKTLYNLASKKKVTIEILENEVYKTLISLDVEYIFKFNNFKEVVKRLTNKFLRSSSVTCFSRTNNNFLMWSHYASKHSGVCLEFEIPNLSSFPFIRSEYRNLDKEKYQLKSSMWSIQQNIYWASLKDVNYLEGQGFINFFEFALIFKNEHDCDLLGLTKVKYHKYAYNLERIFSNKTNLWSYEDEIRYIEINFGKNLFPEDRIRQYPIEALSGIYFGMHTNNEIKKRIMNIFKKLDKDINFYECILDEQGRIQFERFDVLNYE